MNTATRTAPTAEVASGEPAPAVLIRLWDLPLRIFHWSLVAAVLTAVVTGQIGGDWMRVHGIAGQVILALVTFRVVWGFVGSTHARFASFVPTPATLWAYLRGRWRGVGHNPLGALSVLALLGLLGVQAVTGLFANDDISYTGPLAARVSEALSARLTGLHHQTADLLLILIGLHVLAIVFYVGVKKDNLVKPMVTGYKRVEAKAGEPARQGGWLAFVVALAASLAVALTVAVAGGAMAAAPAKTQTSTPASTTPAAPAAPRPAW